MRQTSNALSLILSVTVIATAFVAGVLSQPSPGDGQKTASGTVTVQNPAITALLKCREEEKETLQLVGCHEEAVLGWQNNYSWWSSLALLYLRADMYEQAHEAMNKSVNFWLEATRPQFERGEKNLTDGSMRWVEALRFLYDDESRPEKERKDEAVEMGFLLAKKFEFEHHATDAHSIYYEFLIQTGTGVSQAAEFHRRTGNLLGMILTGPQNETSALWRIGETAQSIIDGIGEHLSTLGDGPFAPVKRMCGIEFTSNEEIKVSDIVANMETCIERWGNLTEALENEPDEHIFYYSNAMRQHAIHKMAMLGMHRTLKTALKKLEGKVVPFDRFGRGALHYAAAWGQEQTMRTLLEAGGDLELEDKGKLTPRTLACGSLGFRKTFDAISAEEDKRAHRKKREDHCKGSHRDKHEDDDIEVTDVTGIDGGWNPRFKRPRYLHCDFDVRDASKMTQSDMMILHTTANWPVVLRNAFFETDGPDAKFKFKKFNKTFGNVLVREEKYARGSRWGLGRANVTSISDYLRELSIDDESIATVNIDHNDHPLSSLVDDWYPPTLDTKKRTNEVTFYDAKVTVPTLHINKKGSKSHHFVRAQGMYHAVVYGQQEWKVLPPRQARTLRSVLPSKYDAFAQRCELITGDVLILPDLWSASWTSKNNGLSVERYLYQANRPDAAPKQMRKPNEDDTTSEL